MCLAKTLHVAESMTGARHALRLRFPDVGAPSHLFGWVISVFRSREELLLENLALRQQLLALRAKRPRHWENRVFNPIQDRPIAAEAARDSAGLESTVRLCHDHNYPRGREQDIFSSGELQVRTSYRDPRHRRRSAPC